MDTTPAPRPFRFPILPRRRFFLSATAAAGAIVVGTATPVARAAPSGTASLTPLPETQVIATTDGMTVEVPVVLGGTLAVSGGTLPQGTRITLTWASTLYQPEAAPGLTKDTRTFACSYEALPSDDGTTGSVSVRIDVDLAEDMYILTVGSVRALAFPDDVIAPPAATTIVLDLPDGQHEAIEEPVDTGTTTDVFVGSLDRRVLEGGTLGGRLPPMEPGRHDHHRCRPLCSSCRDLARRPGRRHRVHRIIAETAVSTSCSTTPATDPTAPSRTSRSTRPAARSRSTSSAWAASPCW